MYCKLIEWGSAAYNDMVALRHEVLRKPLGLHYTSEYLESERSDLLITCYVNHETAGCCILKKLSDSVLQLKQMAVEQNFRQKGIGTSIIYFAEKTALENGYHRLFLHARKEAVGFYQKTGYSVAGDEFEEVGIPHLMMIKELKPAAPAAELPASV